MQSHIQTVTRLLNVTAIVLLVIMSLVFAFSWGTGNHQVQEEGIVAGQFPEFTCNGSKSPHRDVYYIILDAYARDDVLESYYQYDNSDFIANLTARGFRVARRSTANYNITRPSLASSLNLHYIENPDDRSDLQHMVEYNNLTLFFKRNGYTTIFLRSGYAMTERSPYSSIMMNEGILSAFQAKLLDVTFLKYVGTNENRRNAVNGAFSDLSTIPDIPGNTFVFAHIVSPHNPYIFGENGEWVIPSFRDEDYVRQVRYVNSRVEHTIDAILERSDVPPIIVLQADHGPTLEDPRTESRDIRMPILNAYYLPDGKQDRIHDAITPVNSFRLILNEYYGCNVTLLEDRSFYDGTWYPSSPDGNGKIRHDDTR